MTKVSKTEKIQNVVAELLEGSDCELVLLEYKKEGPDWVVRLFIDHVDGVTLDLCESVSRKCSETFDEMDLIKEAYHLEVSSPGIDRPLVTPKHFQRFVGERIFVKTAQSVEGQKSHFGTLIEADDQHIEMEREDKGTKISLAFETITKATLKPILNIP